MKLSKDNPLLTAYALGELAGLEADEVAAAVSADASLRAEVEAIRAFAGEMEAEFSAEPAPRLLPIQRERLLERARELESADQAAAGDGVVSMPARTGRWWIAAPAAAMILAAGVGGLWVLLHTPTPSTPTMAGTQNGSQVKPTSPEPPLPGPTLVPTPTPYGRFTMGTPENIEPDAYYEPSHQPVGSEAISPTGKLAPRPGDQDDPADSYEANPWRASAEWPGSTFGLGTDVTSYTYLTTAIYDESRLPESEAVRVEEMVNYFVYDYAAPTEGKPLALRADLAQCPWSSGNVLLRVAIRARSGDDPEQAVARGARASVAFNPEAVARWRLIGFEGPMGTAEPGGATILAGASRTVLYELIPTKAGTQAPGPVCTVRVDYRPADDDKPRHITAHGDGPAKPFAEASADFRFAAAVADFGMILRGSPYVGDWSMEDVIRQAAASVGSDRFGRREKFLGILRDAQHLLPAE